MSGGFRLLSPVASLLLLAAAVYAADESKSSAAPPKATPKPIEEILHGTKIIDSYRWLEDGKTPETQKWVADEMSYTRALLDPLPGREQIHKRLTELLMIGSISTPNRATGMTCRKLRGTSALSSPNFRPITWDTGAQLDISRPKAGIITTAAMIQYRRAASRI